MQVQVLDKALQPILTDDLYARLSRRGKDLFTAIKCDYALTSGKDHWELIHLLDGERIVKVLIDDWTHKVEYAFYANLTDLLEDITMTQQYEIIDYGFMYSDYFQGIGTYGTGFDEATYGIGHTRHEAYNDAIELIYQHLGSVADKLELPEASEVGPDAEMDEDVDEGCYWHVGIRYNIPQNSDEDEDEDEE